MKSTQYFLIIFFNFLIKELLTSFQSKMFNHQIVGADTNKYRLLISLQLSEINILYLFLIFSYGKQPPLIVHRWFWQQSTPSFASNTTAANVHINQFVPRGAFKCAISKLFWASQLKGVLQVNFPNRWLWRNKCEKQADKPSLNIKCIVLQTSRCLSYTYV